MIAGNLVSNDIIPLRTSDTGNEALAIMSEFGVRHLPIVNNKQLLGVLSEDEILNYDVDEAVGSYSLSLYRPYVSENDHLYEVMKVLADPNLTLVPVIDDEKNYIGYISQDDLINYFARTAPFTEPGSIIVLEMSKRDYSLSEISRIVESEGATILSSFVTSSYDSYYVEVTIKINRPEIRRILATFDRFNYKIKASFLEASYSDSLQERYDMLMTYLNV